MSLLITVSFAIFCLFVLVPLDYKLEQAHGLVPPLCLGLGVIVFSAAMIPQPWYVSEMGVVFGTIKTWVQPLPFLMQFGIIVGGALLVFMAFEFVKKS